MKRFGKFNLVGMMGAVLQIALVWLLTKRAGFSTIAATAIAVECAILHNFAWHERFTWRDRAGESGASRPGCYPRRAQAPAR